jgi:alpha-L-fucosidase
MQNFTVNKDHSYPSFYQKCYFPLDPNEWADIFAASGAKYVQLITL